MVFNYTVYNASSSPGFANLGIYLNGVSNDYFGILLMSALFMICFISFRQWDLRVNLMVTSWLCLVASLMLWALGWLNFTAVALFMIGTAILTIWKPKQEFD